MNNGSISNTTTNNSSSSNNNNINNSNNIKSVSGVDFVLLWAILYCTKD
jgi:hypothetical protein